MGEIVSNGRITLDSDTIDELLGRERRRPDPIYNTTYYPYITRPNKSNPNLDQSESVAAGQQESLASESETAPSEEVTPEPVESDYVAPEQKPWMQDQLARLYSEVPRHNPVHLGRFALDRYHPHDFTD